MPCYLSVPFDPNWKPPKKPVRQMMSFGFYPDRRVRVSRKRFLASERAIQKVLTQVVKNGTVAWEEWGPIQGILKRGEQSDYRNLQTWYLWNIARKTWNRLMKKTPDQETVMKVVRALQLGLARRWSATKLMEATGVVIGEHEWE